ncbi:MAG: sulfurtransferase-like selenium metabolism protein YedF [Candidatus Obscuribacterales bacterium]|nr:sulfurtransferase-like selenium metabolism protein YedF [Candidatus Obscuribacterales bacterium]
MSTEKKQDQANQLDLRGLMCPEPVLRTKKILDQKPQGAVEVLVDSEINVMNLARLANSLGLSLQSSSNEDGYAVVISPKADSQSAAGPSHLFPAKTAGKTSLADKSKTSGTNVVFISKDTFGEGDRDFSVNLLNVFLQTILQAGHRPQAILLANTGVRLMDPDFSVRKVLDDFRHEGVEVLACGLCVEFYGLKDKIKPEQITNMYAICEYLFAADKIISP